MISCVRNNIIIEEPQVVPKVWNDPDTGLTYSGFDNLSLEEMFALGWKEVVDVPLEYDNRFEHLIIGDWYYNLEDDVVTRSYTVEYLSFIDSLTKIVKIFVTNREVYCTSPFVYDTQLFGMDIKLFADLKSRGDLNSAYIKALNGTRLDTDVFSFLNITNDIIALPVSNTDIIPIGDFLYRKVQDAYNLSSTVYWQMLGAGTTEGLKQQIDNGTINLNPWGV